MKNCAINDEAQIQKVSQTLSNFGTIGYFQVDGLRDLVVLNPQWVYETIATAINFRVQELNSISNAPTTFLNSLEMNSITVGWIQHSVFSNYPLELCSKILSIMDHIRITFPLPQADGEAISTRRSVLYKLLGSERPPWFQFEPKVPNVTQRRIYDFSYLPSDILSGIIGRFVYYSKQIINILKLTEIALCSNSNHTNHVLEVRCIDPR